MPVWSPRRHRLRRHPRQHGPRRGRQLASLVVAAAVLAGVGFAGPAAAHTEVRSAVPGSNEVVGGTVDHVELTFFDPVTDPQVRMRAPDQLELVGQVTRPAADVVRFEFDALTLEGEYILAYRVISPDGFPIESFYLFTYDADAPALPTDGDGGPLVPVVAGVALAVIGVNLAALGRRAIGSARHTGAPTR